MNRDKYTPNNLPADHESESTDRENPPKNIKTGYLADRERERGTGAAANADGQLRSAREKPRTPQIRRAPPPPPPPHPHHHHHTPREIEQSTEVQESKRKPRPAMTSTNPRRTDYGAQRTKKESCYIKNEEGELYLAQSGPTTKTDRRRRRRAGGEVRLGFVARGGGASARVFGPGPCGVSVTRWRGGGCRVDDAGEVGEGEERAGGGARAAGCCWATRNFSHLPLSLHALLAPRLLCPPTPTRPGTHRLSLPVAFSLLSLSLPRWRPFPPASVLSVAFCVDVLRVCMNSRTSYQGGCWGWRLNTKSK
jgi:hypothetical protein